MVTLEQLKNKIKELMEQDFYPKNIIDSKENVINETINQKANKTNATQSDAGLMSAEDKIKLDGLDKIDVEVTNMNPNEITEDGIYLIDWPIFLKAITQYNNQHNTYQAFINLPKNDNTDILIDWGDGTQNKGKQDSYSHSYDNTEESYEIIVKGNISQLNSGPIVPQGVKEIELKKNIIKEYMFTGSSTDPLTKVVLPKGITTIPTSCFASSSLNSVNIPDSVITLETACFAECSNLTNINLPNSITSLGQACFTTSGLVSIDIPDSVISIEPGCFYDCPNLTSISIPNSVTEIGNVIGNCPKLINIQLYWDSQTITNSNIIQQFLNTLRSNMTRFHSDIKVTIQFGTTDAYTGTNRLPLDKVIEREG